MFRFVTAGESHGQALIAWVSGVPAGVPVDFDFMQRELHRRQLGYGRGGRQKAGNGLAATGRRRRSMSAAGRKAVSERMRKYWAEQRKSKGAK